MGWKLRPVFALGNGTEEGGEGPGQARASASRCPEANEGGHFGVLRFITIFNKKEPQEVVKARKVNEAVCDIVLELGFIPYKAPAWAVKKFYERMDKQTIEMIKKIKDIIDPQRIMNPGRWLL